MSQSRKIRRKQRPKDSISDATAVIKKATAALEEATGGSFRKSVRDLEQLNELLSSAIEDLQAVSNRQDKQEKVLLEIVKFLPDDQALRLSSLLEDE